MKIIDINSIPRNNVQQALDSEQSNILRVWKSSQRRIRIMAMMVAALSIIFSIWNTYQGKQELAAQQDSFQAIYQFEACNFAQALAGDGVHKGLLAIVQQYPYTKSANLARLYIGISYLHQQKYDEAMLMLKKFCSKDFLLQARAWCLIGDVYSEKKDYKQAAAYYMQAARYNENNVYTPDYLVKAAIAFEANNCCKDAYHCYETIVQKYPSAQPHRLAVQESSRLSAFA